MPSAQFENGAMNCGERRTRDGVRRCALIGVDLYQASPDDIQHVNVRPGAGHYEMVVVDVTDPADPHVLSRAPAGPQPLGTTTGPDAGAAAPVGLVLVALAGALVLRRRWGAASGRRSLRG